MVRPCPKANGGIPHLVELAVRNEEVIFSCIYFMRGEVERVVPFSRVLKMPHVYQLCLVQGLSNAFARTFWNRRRARRGVYRRG